MIDIETHSPASFLKGRNIEKDTEKKCQVIHSKFYKSSATESSKRILGIGI